MLIDDIDSIPEIFTCGTRYLLLLHRNKDGEIGNAQRNAVKRITTCSNSWKEAALELRSLQINSYHNHRIYSAINERDMTKAIHEFKRRQLESDFGLQYEYHKFYYDIQNRFFSCLANPNCKSNNYFLIDCDTVGEYEFAQLQLRNSGLIAFAYPTKNGHHIITRPFNPNDYGDMDINKDALMYIG